MMRAVFYEPRNGHGLPHDPFNALVVPRPIGWISTLSPSGRPNLAPFSFYNAVAYHPPTVMFSTTGPHAEGGYKDSMQNAIDTGEFVVNLTTWDLREQVNLSSTPAPRDVDEFEVTGLTPAPSTVVAAPRVGESPANLECRVIHHLDLPNSDPSYPNTVVFGEVVGVHIEDDILVDGLVDWTRCNPIARLGYRGSYTVVREVFEILRPGWPVDTPYDH